LNWASGKPGNKAFAKAAVPSECWKACPCKKFAFSVASGFASKLPGAAAPAGIHKNLPPQYADFCRIRAPRAVPKTLGQPRRKVHFQEYSTWQKMNPLKIQWNINLAKTTARSFAKSNAID
jgi:hypothetical protein